MTIVVKLMQWNWLIEINRYGVLEYDENIVNDICIKGFRTSKMLVNHHIEMPQ